jgi:hypothetical protein
MYQRFRKIELPEFQLKVACQNSGCSQEGVFGDASAERLHAPPLPAVLLEQPEKPNNLDCQSQSKG